jgi:hypothetical protein
MMLRSNGSRSVGGSQRGGRFWHGRRGGRGSPETMKSSMRKRRMAGRSSRDDAAGTCSEMQLLDDGGKGESDPCNKFMSRSTAELLHAHPLCGTKDGS